MVLLYVRGTVNVADAECLVMNSALKARYHEISVDGESDQERADRIKMVTKFKNASNRQARIISDKVKRRASS
jgi:hypothetical protein